jgi:hypothetical protein
MAGYEATHISLAKCASPLELNLPYYICLSILLLNQVNNYANGFRGTLASRLDSDRIVQAKKYRQKFLIRFSFPVYRFRMRAADNRSRPRRKYSNELPDETCDYGLTGLI